MNRTLDEYYDALGRLKKRSPKIVPKNTKITNDSVSLEAGRKKGSIKKSRPQFAELIAQIDAAALERGRTPEQDLGNKLLKARELAKSWRALYEDALSREQSLVAELFILKKRMAELTGENVIPIRDKKRNGRHESEGAL